MIVVALILMCGLGAFFFMRPGFGKPAYRLGTVNETNQQIDLWTASTVGHAWRVWGGTGSIEPHQALIQPLFERDDYRMKGIYHLGIMGDDGPLPGSIWEFTDKDLSGPKPVIFRVQGRYPNLKTIANRGRHLEGASE